MVWGFDEANGKLVFKGRGQLEDNTDGRKTHKIKEYDSFLEVPWIKEFKGLIKSVVVC